MNSTVLLQKLTTTLKRSKVDELAKIAIDEGYLVTDLIDLTFHEHEQLAFRAAWILENVYSLNSQRFLPAVIYFLDRFTQQDNLSARRHYSKILALMTKQHAPLEIKTILAQYDTEQLVSTAFNWLIDEKVPVAIKSHCLNILANLSAKHTWVREELLETIDFLIDQESIGFYAKAKQIRKQLK